MVVRRAIADMCPGVWPVIDGMGNVASHEVEIVQLADGVTVDEVGGCDVSDCVDCVEKC